MTSGETFRKHHRLLKRAQFRHTERKGHRRAGKHLVVVARRNEVDFSRLGITVTRKVGNAVVRNRWKRRLREVFRRNRQQIPEGWDFVVIVRRGVEIEPAFEVIAEELLYLSRAVASPRDPR